MKIAVFSTKPYDRVSLDAANTGHSLTFLEPHLDASTVALAKDFDEGLAMLKADLEKRP